MKARLPIVIVLLVAIVVTIGIGQARRSQAARAGGSLAGSGTVEATEFSVSAQATGRITALHVDEGMAIESGEVIAELDHAVLDAERKRAEAAAYAARMQYAEAARGARSEEVRARAAVLKEASAALLGAQQQRRIAGEALAHPNELAAAVDSARTQIALAEAQLAASKAQHEEAVSGPQTQEIQAARAALAQAEAAFRGATAESAQAEKACAAREAARTGIVKAETETRVAEAAESAALARQRQVENVPRPGKREQLTRQIAQARSAFELADKSLTRVERLRESDAATEAELDAARSGREQALAAMQGAEAALEDLDAGARAPERAEVAAAVAQSGAAARGAREQIGNALQEQEAAVAQARQQLARARAAVDQAREVREQAAAHLALLEGGTREEKLRQAAAGVSGSEAGLEGARSALGHASQAAEDRFGARQQVAVSEQAVGIAEAKVQAAKAQLDLALAGNTDETIEMARGKSMEADAAVEVVSARIEDCLIRAPRPGTVTEIVLREGEMVAPGASIVRMLDLANLWVRVYLPLREFGRAKLGMHATVRVDADPSQGFAGVVTAVSDESEFTPRNTQTVEERVKQVFWVKVGVEDASGMLKPGMPADVVLEQGA